ncbi:DUF4912 domain-containing protein [Spirochaeta africana]|uniref:DUF4912 domain-containing protein n=1 Tax=Spirochaeta africana (strain ATCC 700263 / DSM 8902 / Z-7692) TaxID=889378 RepID=H9UKY1_SPIAZ|nr:DUF4912 domain-containing protein [Spirochaeta africana]AFG38174.1 hypothetical protein Spiaf_2126 [Spirochaeta africana DSM 8902]
MTRERLQSLSDDVLVSLAEEFEVDWDEEEGRDALISALFDAYEDIRLEHDASNNNLVKVQEKKYDIQEELVNAPSESDGIELPSRYNESRISLLLRDPAWAYCYWDINDYHLRELAESHEQEVTGLILRVVEVACCDAEDGTVIDSFDVPVSLEDTNWYINLPNRDSYYRVRLILQLEESEVLIAASNTILVPLGFLSTPEGDNTASDALIAISGIENLGVSSFGASVPQRIRTFSEQYFLE